MEKKYYCPVCGKNYDNLTGLKKCIEEHEIIERKRADEKARREKEARAVELEKKINELSENIQKVLEEYNKLKTGKTYNIRVVVSDNIIRPEDLSSLREFWKNLLM